MWNNLSEQQQQWLTQAMSAATEYQKALWAQSTEMALQKVQEAGVQVLTADKSLFQQSVAPIYEKFEQSKLQPLIMAIKSSKDKS
jgi:TRAP-type C4-dicarboxylate transport system substrate-binding protein